jgi:hypothetical protein
LATSRLARSGLASPLLFRGTDRKVAFEPTFYKFHGEGGNSCCRLYRFRLKQEMRPFDLRQLRFRQQSFYEMPRGTSNYEIARGPQVEQWNLNGLQMGRDINRMYGAQPRPPSFGRDLSHRGRQAVALR